MKILEEKSYKNATNTVPKRASATSWIQYELAFTDLLNISGGPFDF